jgi:hypothetical protein
MYRKGEHVFEGLMDVLQRRKLLFECVHQPRAGFFCLDVIVKTKQLLEVTNFPHKREGLDSSLLLHRGS